MLQLYTFIFSFTNTVHCISVTVRAWEYSLKLFQDHSNYNSPQDTINKIKKPTCVYETKQQQKFCIHMLQSTYKPTITQEQGTVKWKCTVHSSESYISDHLLWIDLVCYVPANHPCLTRLQFLNICDSSCSHFWNPISSTRTSERNVQRPSTDFIHFSAVSAQCLIQFPFNPITCRSSFV
jgi:hypothetical protein